MRQRPLALVLLLIALDIGPASLAAPAAGQQFETISDYLESRSSKACVARAGQVPLCGALRPDAPYPDDKTDPLWRLAFEHRYGVPPFAGNASGERFVPAVVEAVARHPSNPLRLKNNSSYRLRPGDEWDLRYVWVGPDAYTWLLNQLARPLGIVPSRPGELIVVGPRDTAPGVPVTYSVPESSGSRWRWFVTLPTGARMISGTVVPRLTVTPLTPGEMFIQVFVARGGSDEGTAVVNVSDAPPSPPPPPPPDDPIPPPVTPPPADRAACGLWRELGETLSCEAN